MTHKVFARVRSLSTYGVIWLLLLSAGLFVLFGRPVAAAGGGEVVAYYGNWDIYQHNYFLKDVVNTGAARNLTTLVYSFENISPTTLQCFQDTHAVSTNESNPNAGDGGGDAWGDFQRPFTAAESVSGVADTASQPLKGNLNQLKELKAKYPNLKILLSIGGWTYSKYFSDAAATPARRTALVNSCIDMYLRGNLPTGIGGQPEGGAGVAKNIFDGINVDWEFPAHVGSGGTVINDGHTGNHGSANDGANYASLLSEFRSQLNTQGNSDGHSYYLTAAVPSGPADIQAIPVSSVASSVSWVDIMSYDMHGAWNPTGPTDLQDPLYPQAAIPGRTETGLSVDEAVTSWENGGMPASKITAGVPFYWRGWTGVPAGGNYGFNQSATGASAAIGITNQAGVANYNELQPAGKLKDSNIHWDPISGSTWAYDGSTFYTGDTPKVATLKGQYVQNKGLKGAMVYSLEGDDRSATMLKALVSGMHGGAAPTFTPAQTLVLARASLSSQNSAKNGEPINMIGGNFLLTRDDLQVAGKDNPIDFSLNYNSAAAGINSGTGWGWTHDYRISAQADPDGSVVIQNPDGRTDRYTSNGSGGYVAPSGIYDTLTIAGGNYVVTHKDRSVYAFNSNGLIATATTVNGNALTFTYNSSKQLTTVTNPSGRTLTLTYDGYGNLTGVKDNSNRLVTYTYNELGELSQTKNAAGQMTNYTYDNNHQLTKLTDPRGNAVVNNVYDSQGRVTQQTNGRGRVVGLDYSVPNQTTYTDANGGRTVYFYDANLRITKIQNALGGTSTTSYDAAGNVYQTTDPLGHLTTRLYDSRHNLTQLTDPANGVQSFTYDGNDNLLTRKDQLNRVTTYTYDTHGNVLTKKDPLNKVTSFAYNIAGQIASVTDVLNNLTGFAYDSNGNLVTKTDPSNRNTYYGYDSTGRLTAVETHLLHETDYALDPMDRVTKATDPLGNNSLTEYDADGNKTKSTDANNHITTYEYDANNNLTKTTNPLLKATIYEYDGNDNLTKKTDAKTHASVYAYDLLNRQTQTTDPLGSISKITYDAAGNVATRVDASNRTTSYAYDTLNQLKSVTYPDATTQTYSYDAVGNVLTAINAAGTVTYTYNANNQVLTVTDPHAAAITYTYNDIGSLSTIKYPDNKLVTYTYTPSNQLSTVTDWNSQVTTYLYDNDAQLVAKTLPNGIKATYTYDNDGNLATLSYKKGTAAFTQYNYTRDNVGNITEEDETQASGSHVYNDYAYDAADQLTFNDAPADTYHYSYDDVGNMATAQTDAGTSTYTYDNDNELTAKTAPSARTLTYDPQGNEITDTGKTLTYNYDNQLKTSVSGSLTTSYVYDAIGNRLDKTQTGTGAVNYQYVNDGNNQVLRAKNLTAGTTQYYLYGLDQISQGDTASSTRQYPIVDGMGNVRYLTNSSGATVTNGTFVYDAYGKQASGSTTLTNYGFQTEQKDGESSLIYLRARYYDSTLGRFISQDPLSGSTDNTAGQNGYNYANNNPIDLTDPSGQSPYGIGTVSAPSTSTAQTRATQFEQLMAYLGVTNVTNDVKNCDWDNATKDTVGALLTIGNFDNGAGEVKGASNFVRAVKAEKAAADTKDGIQLSKLTRLSGKQVTQLEQAGVLESHGQFSNKFAGSKQEFYVDNSSGEIYTLPTQGSKGSVPDKLFINIKGFNFR